MRDANAIYLVGHGPCRKPRLLELQHLRILRYREALVEKWKRALPAATVYADLNFPRAEDPRLAIGGFPSLLRLHEAVSQGLVGLVFLDLDLGTSFEPFKFSVIPEMLRNAGARVLNAYPDDEDALLGAIARRSGEACGDCRAHLPADSSDFLAFFPALGGDVLARAVGAHPRAQAFSSENPYSGGRLPFVEDRVLLEIVAQRQKRRAAEKQIRREWENLYQLGPAHPGSLVDELAGGISRAPEELALAGERLDTMNFEKTACDRVVRYYRCVDNYHVFADPRVKGELRFYLYQTVSNGRNGHAPTLDCSPVRFPDRWTRDLEQKFLHLVRHEIGRRETAARRKAGP